MSNLEKCLREFNLAYLDGDISVKYGTDRSGIKTVEFMLNGELHQIPFDEFVIFNEFYQLILPHIHPDNQ